MTDKWLFTDLREIVCTSHTVLASFEILIPARSLTNKNIHEKILNRLEEITFLIKLKDFLLLKTPVINTTFYSVIALFIYEAWFPTLKKVY
jgi:hypothetical protein